MCVWQCGIVGTQQLQATAAAGGQVNKRNEGKKENEKEKPQTNVSSHFDLQACFHFHPSRPQRCFRKLNIRAIIDSNTTKLPSPVRSSATSQLCQFPESCAARPEIPKSFSLLFLAP